MFTRFTHWQPSQRQLITYLALVCGFYLLWLGGLKLTAPELKDSERWLTNSSALSWLLKIGSVYTLNIIAMIIEVFAGLMLIVGLKYQQLMKVGAVAAMSVFAFNFMYLFTNPVWMDSLGGFPIIGSGQGIIKYIAMFSVALYLYAHCQSNQQSSQQRSHFQSLSIWLAWIGILTVMIWIGAMKFFEFEAKGIVSLLDSNFMFRWIYQLWDVRGGANFIGVVELIFAAGILLSPLSTFLGRLGILGIALTTLGTMSFLFSVPGWNNDSYFPLLNGTGVFIIKDQFLLAAAAILWFEQGPKDIDR